MTTKEKILSTPVSRFLCLAGFEVQPEGAYESEFALRDLQEHFGFGTASSLQLLDEQTGIFKLENNQLGLYLLLDGKPSRLYFSLAEGETGYRAKRVSKSNELIARALGVKPHYRPRVIDATAGMGRDAFIMAGLGCEVTLHERCLPIWILLNNALQRLKQQPEFADISARLQLQQTDSRQRLSVAPEGTVIYLDPMFPERKKSALVKKEMRLFKRLAGEDTDADELLIQALQSKSQRVVVKRPKGAPPLANQKPSHVIEGKKFRFDVYLK